MRWNVTEKPQKNWGILCLPNIFILPCGGSVEIIDFLLGASSIVTMGILAAFAGIVFFTWQATANGYKKMRWYIFVLLVTQIGTIIPSVVFSLGFDFDANWLRLAGEIFRWNWVIIFALMLRYIPKEPDGSVYDKLNRLEDKKIRNEEGDETT